MFFSPARHPNLTWATRIFFFFALTSSFGIFLCFAHPQATESAVASIPILVSDFELFSVPASATPPPTPVSTHPGAPIAAPSATAIAAPIATPPATPISTSPVALISTPPATPIITPSATPISTSPSTPIATPSAAPIATPAAAPSKQKPPLPLVSGDSDSPSVQARRLTDFFTATLLQILEKKGYNATRASGQNPSKGVMIRGVFAETDAKNRIRRALWGGTSPNSRFLLYVGIFNLTRPDQPLYQLVPEQPGDAKYGPVITFNNYIPLAKYELDKNPSEENVGKICAQIAASLTALLAANASAFSE
jgi:hypothetical protein